MKRKFLYPVLMMLAIILLYYAEDLIDASQRKDAQQQGLQSTINTAHLLPTSTFGEIIYHDYYTLSYSEKDEQAEWVAYALLKEHLSHNNFKRPYFEIDNQVSTKAAHWRNYKNSGYDRGHLCPAGDRRFDKQAYLETFLTSNISPQEHQFNSGIWNKLEQQVRKWADEYDGVYVITSGVLATAKESIGEEQVSVPKQFYKIVYDYRNGKHTAIAFLLPHKDIDEKLSSFVISIDSLEKITQIDFFPELDDVDEDKLEAAKNTRDWL